MFKKTLLTLLVGGLVSGQVWSQSLTGQITDENGKPLAGAKLSLVGARGWVETDDKGQFRFEQVRQNRVELHIEAPGFIHRNVHVDVPEQGVTDLNLRLASSPLEVIDITASPFHASVIESSLPVSVLAGESLRLRQAATLGDTLKHEVGVHSNFYGSVASSPIIRGLDGPRVLITQNGLDAGDASRVGPDHSVAAEASTATQIEVLRGPATLFYGSGAIGGVVNVVDERIPTDLDTKAEWTIQRESINNEKLVAGSFSTGAENVGFYVDGFWRDSDDYRIPGLAELATEHDDHDHEDEHDHEESAVSGRVLNTASEARGFTLGSSYLLDNGYVGLSYGRLEHEYGIPGHSHDGEQVYADLVQNRVQVLSELHFDNSIIRAVNTRLAYTDYQHDEIEAGEVGTSFRNISQEVRLELLHRAWNHWLGGISLHFKNSHYQAIGEEAFTPPSETSMLALGWMEEKHFGPVLLQLGARIERVKIRADQVLLPVLEVHSHDDEHADEDEHDEDHHHTDQVFGVEQTFTPYSLSAGLVWDFTPGYNLGVSVSRSERAPSAAELLSFGSHISTASYEVGALFEYDADHGAFEVSSRPIQLEVSNNLDLTFRKFSGRFGLILNAFYNQIDNYYYQAATGLYAESGHEHDEHEEESDEHSDELPVYLFTPADVRLHGFESQFIWQINQPFKLTLQADYIRARLRDGGDLPRTPPLRLGAELAYKHNNISANIHFSRYFRQDRIAEYETETAGYNLLDANISYYFDVAGQEIAVYLKGQNLTDEEARVHTSFLKDIAPLPGRSVAIGLRGRF